tara:strand:+ start:986 stop:2170 length:1185 start_codon:yes stop_codon:yes gene_type:complete
MSAENFLSYRYLFSKTNYNIVSVISKFSILVLSIAYFSFLTILSVFSGLEEYSLDFSKSFDPDIKIEANNGLYFSYSSEIDSVLSNSKGVLSFGKTVKGNVVVKYGDRVEYAQILGVDEMFQKIIGIDSIISIGRFPLLEINEALTSYELATNLNLILYNAAGIFDVLSLSSNYPEVSFSPIKNTTPLISSGVFKSRGDLNKNIIITNTKVVQDLYGLDSNEFSEILIKSNNDQHVLSSLKNSLKAFKIRSHKELNETLFKIMNSEKIIVSLIMILIVFISTFNVVASTVMLIVEKEKDIKTLKTLGLSKQNLKNLFFKHNLLINIIGGVIGVALSVFLVCLQDLYSFFKIPGLDTAYPVALETNNMLLVFVTLVSAGLFSGFLSSLVVKKLNS